MSDSEDLARFVRMLGGSREEVMEVGRRLIEENPYICGLSDAVNRFADLVDPTLKGEPK